MLPNQVVFAWLKRQWDRAFLKSAAGARSVVAHKIVGNVLTGANARAIEAETYIEKQVIERQVFVTYEQVNRSAEGRSNNDQDVDKLEGWNGDAPYLGLESFAIDEGKIFFGREKLIVQLLDRIQVSSFVCVAGPSGSGKSSLVRAGLLYALRQGRILGSKHWPLLSFSPANDSIGRLAAAFEVIQAFDVAKRIRCQGKDNPSVLAEGVNCLLEQTINQHDCQNRLVIFVDQFEELFTQTNTFAEKRAFIELLTNAVLQVSQRILVIIALRGEFLDDCAEFPTLSGLISQQLQLVGAMDPGELTRAMMLPAVAANVTIEPGLISQIVWDMQGEPGALLLMQFTLKDLFDAESPNVGDQVKLTLEGYRSRGEIHKALERHASRAFYKLNAEQQFAAEKIFAKLITIDDSDKVTRKTVTIAELRASGIDPDSLDKVLDKLSHPTVRLIATDVLRSNENTFAPGNDAGQASAQSVTLVHERLIDAWPWLHGIVERERETIKLIAQIEHGAHSWSSNSRDKSYLFDGHRLARVQEALTKKQLGLVGLPRQFINASFSRQRWRRLGGLVLISTFVILFIPGIFVGANYWMFTQRANSNWQPIEGFPSHVVTSAAIGPSSMQGAAAMLCVGTNHIGIGCTDDYRTWNLYQVGLPMGNPAWFNSRERFWGALVGSTWSGRIRAVFALAIDPTNSSRIVAFVRQEGLFESSDKGVHWAKLDTGLLPERFPTATIDKLYVDGDFIFVASGIAGPEEQQGQLFISANRGQSFQINFAEYDVGKINDFWVIKSDSLHGFDLYFVSEKGLYQASQGENWIPEQIHSSTTGKEYIWLFYDVAQNLFYVVEYDYANKWSNLARWRPGETGIEQWGDGHKGAIRKLAINPSRYVPGILWALFESGEVVAIDEKGQMTPKGSRPGWPWSLSYTLWFAPDPNNSMAYVPYIGHVDGILKCLDCLAENQ